MEADWFGFGSRILITTRDKHLLAAHQVNLIYEVDELDFDEAIELFSWNTFRSNKLPDDYAKHAIAVQGLPLAPIVLGSLLCGRSIWKTILDRCRSVPNLQIQKILKLSYHALDIACFLIGKSKNYVIKMLESCHLNPEYCIEELIEKSLINIEEDRIWMIDLVERNGQGNSSPRLSNEA